MRRRDRFREDRGPKAIDPASGFEVRLSDLVKQYDGELVARRFVDRQNPQDFATGATDNMALPYSRPEPPDRFMAFNILWEDGYTPILEENGSAILSQGEVVSWL